MSANPIFAYSSSSFESTYEELKLSHQWQSIKLENEVLKVPMRN